jgi:ornithine cyclodeaminase/alanine dehydrogenase-like protein (mu-crystallin family)
MAEPTAVRRILLALQSLSSGLLETQESLRGADGDGLRNDLGGVHSEIEEAAAEQERQLRFSADMVVGLTLSLTAGFVTWVLRAGSLLASAVSAMPLWREFDPMPILVAADEKKREAGEEDEPFKEGERLAKLFDDLGPARENRAP